MQRRHQALQQQSALGLQLGRIGGKQHVAADADAAIVQRDPARGQGDGQGLLQRRAAFLLDLALGCFGLELGGKLQLHAQNAHQDQHERAQQARHQVAKYRPDRRGLLNAAVHVLHQFTPRADEFCWPRSWRRSSTTSFCDMMLRSMISRACAT